jgi:hypothetical protein
MGPDWCDSAGFYAENLLLYAPQAQSEGVLPLPIGKNHKFAPVALGVCLVIKYNDPTLTLRRMLPKSLRMCCRAKVLMDSTTNTVGR